MTTPFNWANAADVRANSGLVPVTGVHYWDGSQFVKIWPIAATAVMGINKSGNWTKSTAAWETVPGYVNRAGFGNTNILNNGMRMGTSASIKVTGRIGITVSGAFYTVSKRFMKNDTVLGSWDATETVHSVNTTVVTGDIIYQQIMYSGGVSSLRIDEGATETYLYTELV
ncbi:hypothetical protein KHQ84_gp054 [Rhodococcus phage Finch]|uniref:Uncharacterized protein n=1 Tax=Rhodococcus phage Finch TaxID=2094144 RepID=A0A2P1JXG1_9CAUD|nr:hypothetical protein KHQ84_gp054 [Rhodococcus phage Finch]AVO24994.1 hypothetical protein SEA_FINCH_54 [Rhodococcus phage Finch]